MAKEKKIKRFSDLEPPALEADEHVEIESVMNQDIEIQEFVEREGSESNFMVIKAQVPGTDTTFTFTCGGEVVMKKIKKAKEQGLLPLLGKIIKEKRYYDIL
jgi:hypothetical protein